MHRSFADFLAMGGYAGFVWSAYAIWLVVIVFNIVSAGNARAAARAAARRRLQAHATGAEDASP